MYLFCLKFMKLSKMFFLFTFLWLIEAAWPTEPHSHHPHLTEIQSQSGHIWNVQKPSQIPFWARCIKLSLWKFYANDNCNLMKCRKVWSNKAYFEYERNWEKLTRNIKQSYSLLFPIWIAGSISQKEADARGRGPPNSISRQILQLFEL